MVDKKPFVPFDELRKGHVPVQHGGRLQRAEYVIKLDAVRLRHEIERGLRAGQVKQWFGPLLVNVRLRDFEQGQALVEVVDASA